MSGGCSTLLLTVGTNCLHNSLCFLKYDKCTALQGSYLVIDSGRERDFSVRDVVHIKSSQLHMQLALGRGGGLRSPWVKSASNGELKNRWTWNSAFMPECRVKCELCLCNILYCWFYTHESGRNKQSWFNGRRRRLAPSFCSRKQDNRHTVLINYTC